MAAVATDLRPRQPRSEQNTPAAFLLALSMHALLVGALWFSVQWRTEPAGAVVVELWGAAPAAEPIVVPPPPPPPRVEPEPERPSADIVIEKKPPPKVEPARDKEKIDAERRRIEAERQRAEAEARRREAEHKQLELERKRQAEAMATAAERRREEERREAVRKAEEARMLAQAGSSGGGSASSGTPGAGGRGDSGYAALLAGVIKPRIVYAVPDGTSPSIHADFEVDLLPTGEILAVRLIKPSGLPGYDAAVERAIRRTDPFPRKPDGTVDRTMRLTFRPVEK